MPQNIEFPSNIFPLGAHVYREPPPEMEEVLSDLSLLKKVGFNMIKIQESWAVDEPAEGEFDFSRVERVIARAGELGLGVYLGLTMEQAPAWMWKKYPDCRFVHANGMPYNDPTQYVLWADGKPGPCWHHPGARAAGERFIAELARRLGKFQNIWTWNVMQEIGYWPNEGGVLGLCYCPHTLSAFREWLKTRYRDLKSLNQTWRTTFGEWDEIEPPRKFTCVPSMIDWRYFMDDVAMVRFLEWKTRAVRENDPGKRPVFSHVGAAYIGSGAEWRWAKAGDFFGSSCYPAAGIFRNVPRPTAPWEDAAVDIANPAVATLEEMWGWPFFSLSYSRCATGKTRAFWAAEFQGGPANKYLNAGRTPSPDDIRRWMLIAMAGGVNGISFWNLRPEIFWMECNGYSLLDTTGESTERFEEAGRIGRAVNESPEIFSLGALPQAETAILINENLYHFCQTTPDQHGIQSYLKDHLAFSIRGNFYRLSRMGVFPDFVEAEELPDGGLKGYKLAILPTPWALDGEYFAHLRKFVEDGGVLISEACPGRFDKYGFCPRSQMVEGGEELFGVRHKDGRMVEEPDGKKLWTPRSRTYGETASPTVLEGVGEFAGARLRASFYLQTLTPTTAKPILMAGDEVAGTCNTFGKGKAVLLGTIAGHSALAHRLNEPEGLFEKLLESADITPDTCGELLRRRRVWKNQEAWFFINPTEREIVQRVDMEGRALIRDLLGDAVIDSDKTALTIKVSPVNVCCLVLTREQVQ